MQGDRTYRASIATPIRRIKSQDQSSLIRGINNQRNQKDEPQCSEQKGRRL